MSATGFRPVDKIHLAFHAYHVAAHDRTQIVESYHFCSGCDADDDKVFQCLIYDSAEQHAKLIGIEYLISEKLFSSLDDEEKTLWHSHKFEVSSGLLMPLQASARHDEDKSGGLCAANAGVEKAQMQLIYKTYGKIIHTWHPPTQSLPLGPPTLMMSATDVDKGPAAEISNQDGRMISTRDRRHNNDSFESHKRRLSYLDLDYKTLDGSDGWVKGKGRQFGVMKTSVKLSNGDSISLKS